MKRISFDVQIPLCFALAVLASATTARAADLVASASADLLVIDQISSDKIEIVYQEPVYLRKQDASDRAGALAWAWSDSRTLWVLRRHDDRLSVARIVELKAEPPREITLADFKLKREPTPVMIPPIDGFGPPTDPAIAPGFVVTTTGQVWVYRCIAYGKHAPCTLGFLRLDRPAPLTTKRPASERSSESELPSVPAPPGYTAALKTVKVRGMTFHGAECKGPNGEWVSNQLYEVWPPENASYLEPKALAEWAEVREVRADWVRAAPPIARFMTRKRGQTWVKYVKDCTTLQSAPILLEGGRWIDESRIRRDDGREIGELHGGGEIAVAPPP